MLCFVLLLCCSYCCHETYDQPPYMLQTFLVRSNGAQSQLHVNDRYAVVTGTRLRFGLLLCSVEFQTPITEPAQTQARSHVCHCLMHTYPDLRLGEHTCPL